jgi:biotin carboxylase
VPIVFFAAPFLSPVAARMVEAIASLPGVTLGVVSADRQEDAPATTRAAIAQHWRVDDVCDPAQLEEGARRLAERLGRPDRIFAAYEQLQVPIAELRERWGVPGLPSEATRSFRDKARMKEVLHAAGLPCARWRLVEDAAEARAFAEAIGFPLVVKPPAGAGSVATFRVRDAGGLAEALEATAPRPGHPVLVEEFLVGSEHSCETISLDGVPVWHSITNYYPTPLEVMEQPWVQWCVVLPREVDDAAYDDARAVGDAALAALGMTTGLTHMEWFRRRDGSVAIGEIGARPPGAQITTLVSRSTDTDFVRAWAEVMVFGTFTPPERKYAAGMAYLRAQGDRRPGAVIRAVHGLDALSAATRALVTDAELPRLGWGPRATYEGDGWILVRHPETARVVDALREIVTGVRVECAMPS